MIIYLHGFASSGLSRKGQQLKRWLAPMPVLTPTFGQDPDTVVSFLRRYISEAIETAPAEPLLLIGSSLGGFYAQYLARQFFCAAVLINPALVPTQTLKTQLGENRVYQTGKVFTFRPSQLQALQRFDIVAPCSAPVPTLVLVDRGDEVIDPTPAIERYTDCAEVRAFDGGNHGFAHLSESLGLIKDFYRRLRTRAEIASHY